MSSPADPPSVDHERRIVDLELLVMHLQRDLETLNGVILEQQREIERLRSTISQLDDRLSRAEPAEPPIDPVLEKPPHY